jgi:hypothetical protein
MSVADRIINNPSISLEWPIKNPLPFDWVAHSPSQASLDATYTLVHSRYANLLIVQRHSRQALPCGFSRNCFDELPNCRGCCSLGLLWLRSSLIASWWQCCVISFLSIFIYQSHRGMDRLGIPTVLRGNPSMPGLREIALACHSRGSPMGSED